MAAAPLQVQSRPWCARARSGGARWRWTRRPAGDAELVFIGRIHTPWSSRLDDAAAGAVWTGRSAASSCSSRGSPRWPGRGVRAGRGTLLAASVAPRPVCAKAQPITASPAAPSRLRSPVRPNPIGTSLAKLVGIEGAVVLVQGLDCIDGTPLLDLKPDRCLFTPIAPPQAGDFEIER